VKKIRLFLKENRFWAVVLAFILVFLIVLKVIDSSSELTLSEAKETSYSTYGTGYKGIYESLEKAGEKTGSFTVERNSKSARFLPQKSLVVCPVGDVSLIMDASEPDDLCDKARNGSAIILLVNSSSYGSDNLFLSSGINYEDEKTRQANGLEVSSCKIGEGEICIVPVLGEIKNSILKLDSDAGAAVLVLCCEISEEYDLKTLVFDEHYFSLAETEEWDILGDGFIMCLAELGLAAVLYMIYKAMRFGAPEKFAEIEKRSETEGVEALALLYRGTGAGSIGFVVRMEALLSDLAKLYDLPKGLSFVEIASEIAGTNQLGSSEIKALCREYLNALENDISARRASKLIEKIDNLKKDLF